MPEILGPSGTPVSSKPMPMPEREATVRERLKEIDRSLDIKWFETAVFNERLDRYEGRYGLIVTWPPSDPRWKLYREGEIGEPFDLLGWFCTDLERADSVPVEPQAMWQKIRELLGRCDNTNQPWKQRMAEAFERNAERRKEVRNEALDEVEQRLVEEYYGPHGPASRHHVPEQLEESERLE